MPNRSAFVQRLFVFSILARLMLAAASAQTTVPLKQLSIEAIFSEAGLTGRAPETISGAPTVPGCRSCSATIPANMANFGM